MVITFPCDGPHMITERETPDQKVYRELSTRITHLDSDIAAAEEKLRRCAFDNPLRTREVCRRLSLLEEEVEQLKQQRQRLMGPWADAKYRVMGWE